MLSSGWKLNFCGAFHNKSLNFEFAQLPPSISIRKLMKFCICSNLHFHKSCTISTNIFGISMCAIYKGARCIYGCILLLKLPLGTWRVNVYVILKLNRPARLCLPPSRFLSTVNNGSRCKEIYAFLPFLQRA